MSRRRYITGYLSLVFFIFGVLSFSLLGEHATLFTIVHLVLGLLCFVHWFVAVGAKSLKGLFYGPERGETKHSFTLIATPLLLTCASFFIILILNLLVHRHDVRLDLTEQQVHSLSEETVALLADIDGNVRLTAVIEKKSKKEQQLVKTLKLMEQQNPEHVQIQIVNPAREPALLTQLGLSSDEKIQLVYNDHDDEQIARLSRYEEGDITGALRGLLRAQGKVFYFLLGHGEASYNGKDNYGLSKLTEALAARRIAVKPLLLSLQDDVPEDAVGVAIIRSQKSMPTTEFDILKKYVERNDARVFLAAEVQVREQTSDRDIASLFDITIDSDVILDVFQRAHESAKLGTQPLVNSYSNHPAIRGFTSEMMTGFHIASSVQATGDAKPLLFSSNNAWGESDLVGLFETLPPTASKGEGDLYGPLPLAAAYQSGEKRAVVFGDSDWLLNANIEFLYNRELALGVFDWLSGFDEGTPVPERHIRASRAPITSQAFSYLLALSFLGPELFVLLGLFIWWRRRV